LKEFLREPEAIFWVYGFPFLMTAALGVAFRNRPVDQIVVDIVDGPLAIETQQSLKQAETPERFKAEIVSDEEARMRLRTGKTDLIVVPSAKNNTGDRSASDGQSAQGRAAEKSRYEYRFDPTRPQSVLAQSGVDDQLQRAAGRRDAADKSLVEVDEPGGRYIDFLVPGLLGMSLMGGGLWGVGFVIVDMRVRKLLKRFLATPMKKSDFMAAIMASRMIFMVPE